MPEDMFETHEKHFFQKSFKEKNNRTNSGTFTLQANRIVQVLRSIKVYSNGQNGDIATYQLELERRLTLELEDSQHLK